MRSFSSSRHSPEILFTTVRCYARKKETLFYNEKEGDHVELGERGWDKTIATEER